MQRSQRKKFVPQNFLFSKKIKKKKSPAQTFAYKAIKHYNEKCGRKR